MNKYEKMYEDILLACTLDGVEYILTPKNND
jgi:hypothetical protein